MDFPDFSAEKPTSLFHTWLYQEFMEEQNYGRSLLAYQSDILRGNASALGNTQATYAPTPSLAQSLIGAGGAGLSALSLVNSMRTG